MAPTQPLTYPGVYIDETAVVPHVVTPATTNLTAILAGRVPAGRAGCVVLHIQLNAGPPAAS